MNHGTDEPFLSRWSRRKAQLRQEATRPAPPAAEPAVPPMQPVADHAVAPTAVPTAPDDAAQAGSPAAAERPPPPPPTLQDVQALTPNSDFTRFVAPGVDKEVKNAAMKKLFADPHFNVMDGLDTYIDDYGKVDPIPKSMLRQMVQARVLGLLDDELEEQPLPAAEPAPPETVAPATQVEALEPPPLEPPQPLVAPELTGEPEGEPVPRSETDADPAKADPPPN